MYNLDWTYIFHFFCSIFNFFFAGLQKEPLTISIDIEMRNFALGWISLNTLIEHLCFGIYHFHTWPKIRFCPMSNLRKKLFSALFLNADFCWGLSFGKFRWSILNF